MNKKPKKMKGKALMKFMIGFPHSHVNNQTNVMQRLLLISAKENIKNPGIFVILVEYTPGNLHYMTPFTQHPRVDSECIPSFLAYCAEICLPINAFKKHQLNWIHWSNFDQFNRYYVRWWRTSQSVWKTKSNIKRCNLEKCNNTNTHSQPGKLYVNVNVGSTFVRHTDYRIPSYTMQSVELAGSLNWLWCL